MVVGRSIPVLWREHPFGNVGCDCDGWMDTPVISLGFAVIPRQRTSCDGTHAVVLTETQKPVQCGQQKCQYWKHL